MTDKEQLEVLYRNYRELEEDRKSILLVVGKKLLTINRLVWDEESTAKKEKLTPYSILEGIS
jgi:hypothetical protein